MAKGFMVLRRNEISPEQVLTKLGIAIDDNNKALCPFHQDDNPSLQVNKEYVFCYGCKQSFDSLRLAKQLLNISTEEAIDWLQQTDFPECSGRINGNGTTKYKGSVNMNLIDYWHQCLNQDRRALERLKEERLLTQATIDKFKFGWRPDHEAFVVPFIYHNEVETVQFRSTSTDDSGKKYYGLKGHQRGSVFNQAILDKSLDYVVVLFGSFDGSLAWQDGLNAVGLNGSMPFKKTEKKRVQKIFEKQSLIFVVPDNTLTEYPAAEQLASWLDAEIRYFDEDLTLPGCDYIDYRKMGKTAEDFKMEVLGIEPTWKPGIDFIDNLFSLYKSGDKYDLSKAHCYLAAKGQKVQDIAIELAKRVTDMPEKRRLLNARCEEELQACFRHNYLLQGGW